MPYGTAGLQAALNGIKAVGTHLALHTADPGTTGAGEGTGVARRPATWGTPAGNATLMEMDATEVAFVIPAGAGVRTYTHFSVRTADSAGNFVCGGLLDEPETFSDNGGTYNFTATLTSASAA